MCRSGGGCCCEKAMGGRAGDIDLCTFLSEPAIVLKKKNSFLFKKKCDGTQHDNMCL